MELSKKYMILIIKELVKGGFMKKFFIPIFIVFLFTSSVKASESDMKEVEKNTEEALQTIEMIENKFILNLQKQPLNSQSTQRVILKKNWCVLNINMNGKVKAQPMTSTYEIE